MSWSIYVQGEAQKVADSLECFSAYPKDGDQSQIETAKTLIREEIAAMVEGACAMAAKAQHPSDNGQPPVSEAVFVRVEASGHHDVAGLRSLSIKVDRTQLLV